MTPPAKLPAKSSPKAARQNTKKAATKNTAKAATKATAQSKIGARVKAKATGRTTPIRKTATKNPKLAKQTSTRKTATKKTTPRKPATPAKAKATSRTKTTARKTSARTRTATPPLTKDIASMIRVNHAGEFGAKRIYQGQLAILGNSEYGDVLRHMAAQEEEHFATFTQMIRERGVRPSIFHPFWDLAGFALGAGTALINHKAAMACTVAIEEVIDEHYAEQVEELGDREPELKAKIEQFREEELEHRDLGLEHDAELSPGYRALSTVIRNGSKLAIWVAKRF